MNANHNGPMAREGMNMENYFITDHSESLQVTPEGKYVLRNSDTDHEVTITEEQAKQWYKKTQPASMEWGNTLAGVKNWLQRQK